MNVNKEKTIFMSWERSSHIDGAGDEDTALGCPREEIVRVGNLKQIRRYHRDSN